MKISGAAAKHTHITDHRTDQMFSMFSMFFFNKKIPDYLIIEFFLLLFLNKSRNSSIILWIKFPCKKWIVNSTENIVLI